MRPILIALTCGLALSACRSTETAHIETRFDPASAAYINTTGATSIQGHAFVRRTTGGTVDASGEVVRLIPATAYADERFAKLYGGARFVRASSVPQSDATDPAYAALTRQTRAESNGRFTFEHVAAGRYYVQTQKTFVPAGGVLPEGGSFYETLTVTGKESEPVKLVVTGP